MSCKNPYIKENQYVVVLDNTGNYVCDYLNLHDTCKQVFLRKLNMQYNVDLNSDFQLYLDGKRVR